MNEKTIEVDTIGKVVFRYSTRAKHINITIKPFKYVSVSIPKGVSFKKAEETVYNKIDWIKKHLPRMKQAEQGFTIFNEDTIFKTKKHTLITGQENRPDINVSISAHKITVLYPLSINIADSEVQEAIRKGIERAWRIEAKENLPDRVNELAGLHGFTFNKVKIKNSKTRWGSSSKKTNNINLSLYLMKLPDHLIDYIILHELVHTKIMNHSRKFWGLLDKVCGNAKGLEQELKEHRIQIY